MSERVECARCGFETPHKRPVFDQRSHYCRLCGAVTVRLTYDELPARWRP